MAKSQTPFMPDFTQFFSDFSMPNVGFDTLISSNRKNLEAATKANQLMAEGIQSLVSHQAEFTREIMNESLGMMNSLMSEGSPEDKLAEQSDWAKESYERFVKNNEEAQELIQKTLTKATEVLNQRVKQSFDEARDTASEAASAVNAAAGTTTSSKSKSSSKKS
jgi:phasin family protein